jgi:hypothetical protein
MQKLPLDPDVADAAPTDLMLTPYDYEHAVTYVRLLDADAEVADWQEVARIVLHIDPIREPTRAWKAFESHLARAKWMARYGYRHLLRDGGFPSRN